MESQRGLIYLEIWLYGSRKRSHKACEGPFTSLVIQKSDYDRIIIPIFATIFIRFSDLYETEKKSGVYARVCREPEGK